jgi:hypothetical protein
VVGAVLEKTFRQLMCGTIPTSQAACHRQPEKLPTTIATMRDARLSSRLELPEELPAGEARLVPQPHGGALLRGGLPGHRGAGGRPKEVLREQMRTMLAETLAAMHAALRGERLSRDAEAGLLADPRVRALPLDVQRVVADAARTHLSARLSHRELIQLGAELAKYGVGTQDELHEDRTTVKYIVRLPARVARAAPSSGPIAVIEAGRHLTTSG